MTDYKQLANYYLKFNKKRSVITILGVAIAVIILYAGLNLALNYYDDGIKKAREKEDYEICFLDCSKEQMEGICNDEEIRSAYVGTITYSEGKVDNSALFVNTKHPYSVAKTKQRLEDQYQVQGEYNEQLAYYYFVSEDVNGVFIAGGFIIWIAYIFAIVGVGIIRNSIQLNSLEQIKDFGILRCIGATKKQLRAFIYKMGATLELIGVVIGVIVGYPVSAFIGYMLHVSTGFHFIPVFLIIAVYLFDLYFAMQECCRFVNDMTPVSAVRGEFRIRKEKIKIRRKSLISRAFGVEGDYAYKSLRRNPGRYWKSVVTIGIGIAACSVVIWINANTKEVMHNMEKIYGYYQIHMDNELLYEDRTPNNYLGSKEAYKTIRDLEHVKELRMEYSEEFRPTNVDEFTKYFTDEAKKTELMKLIDYEGQKKIDYRFRMDGLEDNELKQYESELVEGTVNLSENGIIAVCDRYAEEDTEFDVYIDNGDIKKIPYLNCKVGDTIDVYDCAKVRERAQKLEKEISEALEKGETPKRYVDGMFEIYDELHAAGEYKTYVVEGVVKGDRGGYVGPLFITNLDNFLNMTGRTKEDINGIKIRVDSKKITTRELGILSSQIFELGYESADDFMDVLMIFDQIKNVAYFVAAIIMFVVVMSSLNIINTTASSLYMRRKEFAQLRVIGMSKKRLIYTVLLEGITTTISANILGNVIAFGVLLFLVPIYDMVFAAKLHIYWPAVVTCLIASGLLLCGSVYFPLRELPLDMASDLTTDGD